MKAKEVERLEKMFNNMSDDEKHKYLLAEYDRLVGRDSNAWDDESEGLDEASAVEPESNKFLETRRLKERYAPSRVETWSYDLKPVTDDTEHQRNIANYPLNHPIYQTWEQSFPKPQGKPYVRFDGKNLYWQDGDTSSRSWRAMSGQPWAQDVLSQRNVDEGPIPEGVWTLDYSTRLNAYRNKNDWNGRNKASWGEDLVKIKPKSWTNTHGRDGFNLHGGKEFGSAGCVDLSKGSSDFMRYLDDYGNDMDLVVEYKNLPLSQKYKK